MASPAYERFIASMNIGFDEWHDGVGYDLEALAEMAPAERGTIETMLRGKASDDWRVVEALAALGTPGAIDAVRRDMKSDDPVIRLAAARALHARGELTELGEVLGGVLGSGNGSAFSQALDMIGWHKVTGTIPVLLRLCLSAWGEDACHCAAMLFYLHGVSKEAFDWDHRAFFLRFNTPDVVSRKEAFKELCVRVGVNPEDHLR